MFAGWTGREKEGFQLLSGGKEGRGGGEVLVSETKSRFGGIDLKTEKLIVLAESTVQYEVIQKNTSLRYKKPECLPPPLSPLCAFVSNISLFFYFISRHKLFYLPESQVSS